jgi:hypothetical protein
VHRLYLHPSKFGLGCRRIIEMLLSILSYDSVVTGSYQNWKKERSGISVSHMKENIGGVAGFNTCIVCHWCTAYGKRHTFCRRHGKQLTLRTQELDAYAGVCRHSSRSHSSVEIPSFSFDRLPTVLPLLCFFDTLGPPNCRTIKVSPLLAELSSWITPRSSKFY